MNYNFIKKIAVILISFSILTLSFVSCNDIDTVETEEEQNNTGDEKQTDLQEEEHKAETEIKKENKDPSSDESVSDDPEAENETENVQEKDQKSDVSEEKEPDEKKDIKPEQNEQTDKSSSEAEEKAASSDEKEQDNKNKPDKNTETDQPEKPKENTNTSSEEPDTKFNVSIGSSAVIANTSETDFASESLNTFFNDSAFIGDSVMKGFELYTYKYGTLESDATFLTLESFASRHALSDVSASSYHPSYNGQKMKVEDALALSGCKKAFIFLGINDVLVTPYTYYENYIEFLSKIKEKNPNISLFIVSATYPVENTPKLSYSVTVDYRNKLYDLNTKLKAYCNAGNGHFIDVATQLCGDNGFLIPTYSSDNYVHLTWDAYKLWQSTIENYVSGVIENAKVKEPEVKETEEKAQDKVEENDHDEEAEPIPETDTSVHDETENKDEEKDENIISGEITEKEENIENKPEEISVTEEIIPEKPSDEIIISEEQSAE